MRRITLFINRFLHLFEIRRIKTREKIIYLTFDDGPESDITEFVLNELQKHGAKATFFCCGNNAEMYPGLLERIRSEGHSVGNHTYSHINSFETPASVYVADVKRADAVLKTHLFRPPWGSITIWAFLRLAGDHRVVYWSLMSGDTALDKFDKQRAMNKLKTVTRPGDVVLFHFCRRHERETRQLLPDYLEWLVGQGYRMETIN